MNKEWVKEKWILAVSGGPDSMALFQHCLDEGVQVVAAHVNYKKRESAERDEKGVREFCEKHKIPLEVSFPSQRGKGNFQGWARKARYAFFKDCAKKYQATGVLVAHHQDDVLETYILQKRRKAIPRHYGLQVKSIVEGVLVYRPLLSWTKEECIALCETKKVPTFLDESNLKDDYQRNRIRHEIIEKLSSSKRAVMLQEIDAENKKLDVLRKGLKKFEKNQLDLEKIKSETKEQQCEIFRFWLNYHEVEEARASLKHLEAVLKMLESRRNFKIPLKDKWLSKQGTICEIVGNEDKSYSFVLQSYQSLKTPYFEICEEGTKDSAVTLSSEDYPLCIRNAQAGDAIELRMGTKKIHRWFIDKKIPLAEREVWPVVENAQGKIILVPKIGCDVQHYTIKPNFFVVK